ncbi:MAG: DUF6787 family protein [Reichenbachiella sp.]|uniref:DUF6787 family protein n=1 Tax=Reichenbachiella sp. TaxID=2184521 RepID=UPI0032662BB5
MSFLQTLKKRWKFHSIWRVVLVLIVFACTGFTVMFLKAPALRFFDVSEEYQTLFTISYYILIWPVYNIILLVYGFLFGQFDFFWTFEKNLWFRMTGQKHRIKSE